MLWDSQVNKGPAGAMAFEVIFKCLWNMLRKYKFTVNIWNDSFHFYKLLRWGNFKGFSSVRIGARGDHLPWLKLCLGLVWQGIQKCYSIAWCLPIWNRVPCARNRLMGMTLLFYSFVSYEPWTVAGQKFSENESIHWTGIVAKKDSASWVSCLEDFWVKKDPTVPFDVPILTFFSFFCSTVKMLLSFR